MKNYPRTIVVVNRYFYPVMAGIESCLLQIYSRLVQKGWKITVHVSKNTLEKKNVLSSHTQVKGIDVIRYPYGKISFMPKINYKNLDILSLNNFDIFPHVIILFNCLYLKLIGRKRFQLVLSPHGGFTPDWSSFPFPISTIKKIYHYTLGTILINLTVDAVQAVSVWEKNELIKYGINKSLIHQIDNGIENEAFKKRLRPTKKIQSFVKVHHPYIVQLGRIHPTKNYQAAIQALSYLPQEVKLVVIGPVHDSSYRKKIEVLIKKLHFEKRVIFTGKVLSDNKYYILKRAQALIQMSFAEASSLSIFEAMSQGLVCVVSKHPALTSVIKDGENGYAYDFSDYENAGKRLSYIISHRNTSQMKKIMALNKIMSLDRNWDTIAARIELLYENLLTKKYSFNQIHTKVRL